MLPVQSSLKQEKQVFQVCISTASQIKVPQESYLDELKELSQDTLSVAAVLHGKYGVLALPASPSTIPHTKAFKRGDFASL